MTIEKIVSLDLSYELLTELTDIDTEDDLHKWLADKNGDKSELIKKVNELLVNKGLH